MFWLKQRHKLKGEYSFVVKNSGSKVELDQVLAGCGTFSLVRPQFRYLWNEGCSQELYEVTRVKHASFIITYYFII